MGDETSGIVAKVNKDGRSLDLDTGGGIPLARVRLDADLLAEQHQEVVRRLVACWNLHRDDALADLEARAVAP